MRLDRRNPSKQRCDKTPAADDRFDSRDPEIMTVRQTGSIDTSQKAHIVLRFGKPILFLIGSLCLAGGYAGLTLPSSVFPQTDFPRVVILIDNGVMPGDEMMATVTRPVEESMKDIPGTTNIRSTTGRGSAAIDVFFDWSTDMGEAEQYVLGRLAQIRESASDRHDPSPPLDILGVSHSRHQLDQRHATAHRIVGDRTLRHLPSFFAD